MTKNSDVKLNTSLLEQQTNQINLEKSIASERTKWMYIVHNAGKMNKQVRLAHGIKI